MPHWHQDATNRNTAPALPTQSRSRSGSGSGSGTPALIPGSPPPDLAPGPGQGLPPARPLASPLRSALPCPALTCPSRLPDPQPLPGPPPPRRRAARLAVWRPASTPPARSRPPFLPRLPAPCRSLLLTAAGVAMQMGTPLPHRSGVCRTAFQPFQAPLREQRARPVVAAVVTQRLKALPKKASAAAKKAVGTQRIGQASKPVAPRLPGTRRIGGGTKKVKRSILLSQPRLASWGKA